MLTLSDNFVSREGKNKIQIRNHFLKGHHRSILLFRRYPKLVLLQYVQYLEIMHRKTMELSCFQNTITTQWSYIWGIAADWLFYLYSHGTLLHQHKAFHFFKKKMIENRLIAIMNKPMTLKRKLYRKERRIHLECSWSNL